MLGGKLPSDKHRMYTDQNMLIITDKISLIQATTTQTIAVAAKLWRTANSMRLKVWGCCWAQTLRACKAAFTPSLAALKSLLNIPILRLDFRNWYEGCLLWILVKYTIQNSSEP